MNKKMLAIHQGWELYGSDRSFLHTLKVIREAWPALHICAIVPKHGLIVEPLSALADEVCIEDIGAVTSREMKNNPLRSVFKMLRGAVVAAQRINGASVVYINTIVPFGYLLAALFTCKHVLVHVREIPSPALAKIFALWFRIIRAYLIFNSRATCSAFGLENYKRGKVILNAVEKIESISCDESTSPILNLLIIGRINAWKGHLLLVESIALLTADERARISIRVVGDAPVGQTGFHQQLISEISKYNLSSVFSLFPFERDPARHYNWSHIVVVPSILPEPFGRVAPEAMSVGKAIIAANHGGLSEIVVHKETGWLIRPGDSNDLAAAIRDALSHPALVQEYGAQGKQRYMDCFTPDVYKKQFLAYLNSIPAMKEIK